VSCLQVVYPQAKVIQRRLMNARLSVGIERLHQIELYAQNADAELEDSLADVLGGALIVGSHGQAHELRPKFDERLLIQGSERNLLHSQNAERARDH